MKHILLLLGILTLITTSGCIVPVREERGYYGRGRFYSHREYRSYVEPGVTIRLHAE